MWLATRSPGISYYFIIAIASILKVGFGITQQASMLLANSNCNIPLVLECDPSTHVIMGPFGHSSRYLDAVPWSSFVMPNEVTWRVHLFSVSSKDIPVPINAIDKTQAGDLFSPAWLAPGKVY